MILVTLGTQDKSFVRLLKALDGAISKNKIDDQVIVQAGFTNYKSKNMKIFDFVTMEELDNLIKNCDILITHGGVGSIMTGLKYRKKVIAAARLKEYQEHTNNHQLQIINAFAEQNLIIPLEKFEDIAYIIKNIKTFKPKKYYSNIDNFNEGLQKIIDSYLAK